MAPNLFRQARLDHGQESVNVRGFKGSSGADIPHDFISKGCKRDKTRVLITKMESEVRKGTVASTRTARTRRGEQHSGRSWHIKDLYFPTRLSV